jgi:hypothetical protein
VALDQHLFDLPSPLPPELRANSEVQALGDDPAIALKLTAGGTIKATVYLGLQPPGEDQAQEIGRAESRSCSVVL